MTKFQALFVLWLRHETLQDCSWRKLASRFHSRYDYYTWSLLDIRDRPTKSDIIIGNQIDGIELEKEAFRTLVPDWQFGEPIDLYECDLRIINANLKRHIKN